MPDLLGSESCGSGSESFGVRSEKLISKEVQQSTSRLTSQSLLTQMVGTAVGLSVAWLLQVQCCVVPSDPLCV